mmetsp:Transcript_34067/g.98020  ORF Transcript_34067/g.98020 Transcript_34067/m.98020 type:complete len:456 (+) Transcript_34067:587-1954(+)
MFNTLIDPYAGSEEPQECHKAKSLSNAVGQESPAVDGQCSLELVFCEVSKDQTVHWQNDRETSHEDVDHQQLEPEEAQAPQKDSLGPAPLNGPEDARGMVLKVHELAEAESVALGLGPSGHQRLEPAVALRRIVHDRQEDRRDLQAAPRGKEALQAHVPVLRYPVWVPALDVCRQRCGNGVRRVWYPSRIRVRQVCKLVLGTEIGRKANNYWLGEVVLIVDNWGLPNSEVPVWCLVWAASGMDKVIRERCKVLRVELAVGIPHCEDGVQHVQPVCWHDLTEDFVRSPSRVRRLARHLTRQTFRMVGGLAQPKAVLEFAHQQLCLLFGTCLACLHSKHQTDLLPRHTRRSNTPDRKPQDLNILLVVGQYHKMPHFFPFWFCAELQLPVVLFCIVERLKVGVFKMFNLFCTHPGEEHDVHAHLPSLVYAEEREQHQGREDLIEVPQHQWERHHAGGQ